MTITTKFLEKYPNNGEIVKKWVISTGVDLELESINKQNIDKFVCHLCDNMARSSARQYAAKLKSVIELFTEDADLPSNWRKMLSVKDDESQQVYLTEDEIKKIIEYMPVTINEATVTQQFIIGCLTGARHSDYSRFTTDNTTQEGNLVYVSKKTHAKIELPLAKTAKDILFSNVGEFAGAYMREVSDPTFNDTIRRICRTCCIDDRTQLYRRGRFWTGRKYEAVSSHTARRSFCTNLYLRCRDLMLVSKLAGHSSTAMTERYICCGMESLTESAMNYFKEF